MNPKTVTYANFVDLLISSVPELEPVAREHLEDNDELLPHLLVSDTLLFAERAFADKEFEVLGRLLSFLDEALTNGDERIEDAVALSFVENSEWWNPEKAGFLATWPAGLKAELELQRNWKPSSPAG